MPVLSELRYATTRRAKLITGVLAFILFGFVATTTIAGILLYQILHPPRLSANLDVSLLPGQPVKVAFTVADAGTREGWFFPGLRGAATIVVCHGYQSQRADVLTLVTALQEHQFNVFVFDFSGHGSSPGVTTLGYHEAAELLTAIQALAKRDDVDRTRFGVWGTDLGGYAALSAAISDPRIRALILDSVYGDPRDIVRLEVDRSGLALLPLVRRFCVWGFELANRRYRREPPLADPIGRLKGTPKLFIESRDRPALASLTQNLFAGAPDPREQLEESASYSEMSAEERRTYESVIVNFFLRNLPPAAPRAR